MDDLQGAGLIAEGKVHSSCMGLVDEAHLEALHCEGDGGSDRNRIKPVVIAVEVHLNDVQGIEDPVV